MLGKGLSIISSITILESPSKCLSMNHAPWVALSVQPYSTALQLSIGWVVEVEPVLRIRVKNVEERGLANVLSYTFHSGEKYLYNQLYSPEDNVHVLKNSIMHLWAVRYTYSVWNISFGLEYCYGAVLWRTIGKTWGVFLTPGWGFRLAIGKVWTFGKMDGVMVLF